MIIKYDPEVDVIRITLKDVDIEESDEDTPGIILDFDAKVIETWLVLKPTFSRLQLVYNIFYLSTVKQQAK